MNRIATAFWWLVKVLQVGVSKLIALFRNMSPKQHQSFADGVRNIGVSLIAAGFIATIFSTSSLPQCLFLTVCGTVIMLRGVFLTTENKP